MEFRISLGLVRELPHASPEGGAAISVKEVQALVQRKAEPGSPTGAAVSERFRAMPTPATQSCQPREDWPTFRKGIAGPFARPESSPGFETGVRLHPSFRFRFGCSREP